MTVLDTSDYNETVLAVKEMYKYTGPVYIRIRRDPIESIESLIHGFKTKNLPGAKDFIYEKSFKIGKGQLLKEGKQATIIACGAMVHKALEASLILASEKVSVRVINLSTIKPIDRDIILDSAKRTGAIVTVEEHQYMGGMGSAVAEVVIQDYPVPMKILGVNNQFGETGTQDELLLSKDLTVTNIVYNVKSAIKMKKGDSKD
jgi:transketolase